MDQDFNDVAIKFIQSCCPDEKIILQWNKKKKDNLSMKIFIWENLIESFKKDLLKGHKIAIASNTLEKSKILLEVAEKLNSTSNLKLRIKYIDQKSTDDPNFIKNINKEIINYDVFFYSPTV